jgi:hypothetical protein
MSVADILSKLAKVKPIGAVLDWIINTLGKIDWHMPANKRLRPEDLQALRDRLAPHYYVMVTRNGSHLSAYLVGLGNFLLTGKFSYWSHVLMNLENTVVTDADFRFVEADRYGVKYSTFADITKVNAIALLKPKALSLDDWTKVLDDAAAQYVGRPYDNLFDLANDSRLSCVELVRDILMKLPNYATDFANFEAMIASKHNLTPTMYYECPDFEIVYEVRH